MKSVTNFPASSGCSIKQIGRLLTALFICSITFGIAGQERTDTIVRPVASAYMLEAGSSNLRDTYLTPLNYSGWNAALSYERTQAMQFDPERWIMKLDGRLSFGATRNPNHSATMWSINFRPSWSMLRRFNIAPGLTAAIGPNIDLNIGSLYLMRNSNNPVAVQASTTIGASAMGLYSFNLGKLPITLRYQPTLPLIGVFFAPDYDELYYEIWLGNHSGLCHMAWPGSFFRLDNLLTADLHFGATTLRLGYRCEYFSSKASDIVSRRIEHSFVIGIVSEWISLRSHSHRTPDARIISSMY